ncbi:LOW QUALITY PROTEIN: hypothetical protein HID58_049562, partial [Brassica napus]
GDSGAINSLVCLHEIHHFVPHNHIDTKTFRRWQTSLSFLLTSKTMTAAPPPNCGFWNFGRQKCDKSSVPTIHFTNPPFSFQSHKKKFLERDRARAITTPSDLTVLGRSSENLTVSAILDWFNNGGSEDGGINKCVIERFDKEAAEMYKRSFKYVWVPHCAVLIIDSTTVVLKLGLAEVDWRQKREFLLEKRVKGVDVKEALRLQKENNFLILDVRPEAKLKGHPPGAINVEMYRLIREWTPWDIARRLGSAFFRIFSGTEENPEFIQTEN